MICLSVMFVKQHSAVDVIAALPLGLLAECLVFGGRRSARAKKPKPAKSGNSL